MILADTVIIIVLVTPFAVTRCVFEGPHTTQACADTNMCKLWRVRAALHASTSW